MLTILIFKNQLKIEHNLFSCPLFVKVQQSDQVKAWIESYRELLNKYKLWEKRAEFDVLQMKLIKSRTALSIASYPLDSVHSPPQSLNQSVNQQAVSFKQHVTPKHQSYPNGNQHYLLQYNAQTNNLYGPTRPMASNAAQIQNASNNMV